MSAPRKWCGGSVVRPGGEALSNRDWRRLLVRYLLLFSFSGAWVVVAAAVATRVGVDRSTGEVLFLSCQRWACTVVEWPNLWSGGSGYQRI